jgi:hypothetical protein
MTGNISFTSLLELIEPSFGTYDVACPQCGPDRRSEGNRRRRVLRIWYNSSSFVTYSCARCGIRGYARANGNALALASNELDERPKRQRQSAGLNLAKRDKARWLWRGRQPIEGTPAETYLRKARCYAGPLPPTLGFLAPCGEHPPAMIAAFGRANDSSPGDIFIAHEAITGVHLTRLSPDGRAKAGTATDKIMIGTPSGSPIALAVPSDLGGLAITEGVEDALSVHEATGLGAWAAGAASFMPALAAAVPDWIECVTIMVDDDDAGRCNAYVLAELLVSRGFDVRLVIPR